MIALHFERGGELNRALEYRKIAGTEAAKANALVEAEEHLARAIALQSDLGDASESEGRRAELLLLLGGVQMPLYGFPSKQVRSTYTECCALLENSADHSLRFDATWGLWLNRSIAGDFEESRDLMSQLDDLADKTGEAAHRLQAHHANWTTSYNLRGDIKSTLARTEQGTALYTIEEFGDHYWRYGGHDPGACGYANGSLSCYQLGYPDKAKVLSQRGLELARNLQHPPSLGMSAIYAAILHQWVGEPTAILELQDETALAPAHLKFAAAALNGWARARLGDVEGGLKQCADGVQGYGETGATARISYLRCLLAGILVSTDRLDDALEEMDQACSIISDAATRAEQLRVRSEILERLGKTELAEKSYLDALATARSQEALAWELRTAVGLSRLWLSQGRLEEAMVLLPPVYERFTEGFETPDLKRAKELLDQLAR
mgnify:FL=1